MAKSQLFGPPVLKYIYKHGGVFPVRRGHHDEEAFKTAYDDPRPGRMLLIYAEGGRSRTGELGEPKPGIGRLALESGVPVVPVAIHGSAGVRRWKRFRFPKVTVQFGEPLTSRPSRSPTREQQLEVATEIFARGARDVRGRWLLVAALEPGVEVRVVPRGDHASGNWRWKSCSSCSERRQMWASKGRGGTGASPSSWAAM